MTIVLWILVAILWTIVVFAAGIYAGRHWDDDKKAAVAPDANHKENVDALSSGAKRRLEAVDDILARVKNLEERPPEIEDHYSQTGMTDEEKVNFESLGQRVKALEDRDAAYQDRFTRVERKAGLSV